MGCSPSWLCGCGLFLTVWLVLMLYPVSLYMKEETLIAIFVNKVKQDKIMVEEEIEELHRITASIPTPLVPLPERKRIVLSTNDAKDFDCKIIPREEMNRFGLEQPRTGNFHNESEVWKMWEVTQCIRTTVETLRTLKGKEGIPRKILEGYFVAKRLMLCDLTVPITRLPDTTEYLKKNYGPDELTLLVEGSEVFSHLFQHLGDCVYKAEFRLTVQGSFYVTIQNSRENYQALNELIDAYPDTNYDYLLHPWYTIVFGSQLETEQDILRLRVEEKEMPLCMGGEAGRWIYV